MTNLTPTRKQPDTFQGMKSQEVAATLAQYKGMVSQALPMHMKAERIIAMAVTMITQNATLAQCSAASTIGALVQAAMLGLRPAPALGECYFVPYGGKTQFQIGYRGYLKLAHQSGQLRSIYAEVVRTGDTFEHELGLEPKLRHIPVADDTAPITHAYAVAHLNGGGIVHVVLTRSQIERLRMRSPSQRGTSPTGAWATDYESMAKAKALKQLSKYLPMSDEITTAFATDEAVISEAAMARDHTGVDVAGVEFIEAEVVEQSKEGGQA